MKFTLTFKMPDVLDQLEDQVEDHLEEKEMDEEERYVEREQLLEECRASARKHLKYSEYISVEFDTDDDVPPTVLPCGE